jgi:restriction system protein
MAAYYPYRSVIRNDYLNVRKEVCARTEEEFDWRVRNQLAKWKAQEQKKRQLSEACQHVADLRAKAEYLSREVQERIKAYRTLLIAGLSAECVVNWNDLFDRSPFPPPPAFVFDHPKPDLAQIRAMLLGLEPNEDAIRREWAVPDERPFLELFLPFLRAKRQRLEGEAADEYQRQLQKRRTAEQKVVATYNQQVREYNQWRRDAKQMHAVDMERYEKSRQQSADRQARRNRAVSEFRDQFERGSSEAVARYVQMALERSAYPDGITGEPDVAFDEPSRTLVVNFWLPHPSDLPTTIEYKFIATRKEIKPVEMKKGDFQALFDDVLHQIALRTIYESFRADYPRHAQAVVFNGWVRGVNAKTGHEFTSCILSCHAPREQFEAFDLARVSPRECVRGLRGLTAGPLAELAPVKPIIALNRDDDRFVEARAIMGELDPRENLALMDWEDFEHLVRELFERVFQKDGCEVKVTQASRDRGVDAVAFDPDPIRGGKFVIQAKRYNAVVPVSAVRDLYGTMIDEGATKGILVTTSHFGRDSHEFAKDKPITLIDGPNLVHMFQEHGRAVHIALAPKGERPGLGH